VIQSIADGRKAALAIDRYLGGNRIEAEKARRERKRQYFATIIENEQSRLTIPVLEPEERKRNFDEIELPFDHRICQQEAFRCLRCDVR
jgi:NADH-quinone oxidoreductase subunit F